MLKPTSLFEDVQGLLMEGKNIFKHQDQDFLHAGIALEQIFVCFQKWKCFADLAVCL